MSSALLLPIRNSSSRYCADWNPDERPSVLRNAEYVPGLQQLLLDGGYPRQPLERRTEIVAAHAVDDGVELVQTELHP
jgi:hypothetical protein